MYSFKFRSLIAVAFLILMQLHQMTAPPSVTTSPGQAVTTSNQELTLSESVRKTTLVNNKHKSTTSRQGQKTGTTTKKVNNGCTVSYYCLNVSIQTVQCILDSDCSGNLKCCMTCDGMQCTDPIEYPSWMNFFPSLNGLLKDGQCPTFELTASNSCPMNENTCRDMDQCKASEMCCIVTCNVHSCISQRSVSSSYSTGFVYNNQN